MRGDDGRDCTRVCACLLVVDECIRVGGGRSAGGGCGDGDVRAARLPKRAGTKPFGGSGNTGRGRFKKCSWQSVVHQDSHLRLVWA